MAAEGSDDHPAKRKDGLPKGAPRRPGLKSVFIRGGIAAAIFFMFLYFINKDTPAIALVWSLAIFVFMIPLGMLLDRLSYRMTLKRWMKSQGRA